MRTTRVLRTTRAALGGSGLPAFWDVNLFGSQASYDAYVASTTVSAKDKSRATLLTQAVATALGITNAVATTNPPGTVVLRDGTLGYGAHNLFLQSAAPATQTITILASTQYTIWATGTGSIVLTSGGTGTLTLSGGTNSLTFTSSGTSLVCTVSGTLTFAQLNRGPTALDAVTTTSAAVYAPRISCDRGATQNMLLNSATLSTQTVTVVSGQVYTISALGTGSVALSSGGAGTLTCNATLRNQLTFTASGTSVVCTVTGSVLQANFNPGYATNYLATTGAILYTAGTPRSQNLATGSGTQSVTVVPGCVYTVIHQAGGTYTLSGAGSGTTTAALATTVVAATSTLTLTVTSAPTLLQVYEGTASMTYVAGPYSEYPSLEIVREVGRTNLLTYSEQFDNAAWTKDGATVTANQASWPGGTLTADLVSTGVSTGEHRVYQAAGSAVATSHSVFAAAGTASFIALSTGTNGYYAVFNLSTGTVVASVGVTSKIEPVGFGFHRCSIAGSAAPPSNFLVVNVGESAANAVPAASSTGTSKTVYLAGAQLEAGTFPTSYIPTTTAAVTRDADLIRPPTTYINDTAQTTVCEFVAAEVASTTQPLLTRAATTPGYVAYLNTSIAKMYDGTNQPQVSGMVANVLTRMATRYGGSATGVSVNGSAIGTSGFDGTMGTSGDAVGIGDNTTGAGFTGGIRRIAISSRAANDAELQAASAGGR